MNLPRSTMSIDGVEYVLVPREPDDGMIEAGHEALIEGQDWGKQKCASDIYAAIIAARPATPTQAPDGVDERGLAVHVKPDGTWLEFKASGGRSAMIQIEALANKYKIDGGRSLGFIGGTLLQWSSDRQEALFSASPVKK